MPLIQVESRSRTKISKGSAKNAAKLILNALGYTKSELSILFVDDEEMSQLYRQYRGKSQTTDVLSFSMREGEFGEIETEMLGDVVISAQTAKAMSEETGSGFNAILDLLLVHGILHLLEYDHEAGPALADEMKSKTSELLGMLGHSHDNFQWFFDME